MALAKPAALLGSLPPRAAGGHRVGEHSPKPSLMGSTFPSHSRLKGGPSLRQSSGLKGSGPSP